jgi:hypothetical protein
MDDLTRRIIRLRETGDGLSFGMIGARLGITKNAALSRYRRAKATPQPPTPRRTREYDARAPMLDKDATPIRVSHPDLSTPKFANDGEHIKSIARAHGHGFPFLRAA